MLRQRLLTAAVLAPIFIAAIYVLPLSYFAALFALVVSLAAWEWAGLALPAATKSAATKAPRIMSVLLLLIVLAALWWLPHFKLPLLLLTLALWLVAFTQVLHYRSGETGETPQTHWWQGYSGVVFATLLLAGAWCALLTIRAMPAGSHLLLMLFALVWLADAGAYFAGKAFGARKLAPEVSPGKTWEGALGGMAVSLGLVLAGLWGAHWLSFLWVPVLLGLIVISVLGDLFESVLKRSAGAKDSGQLLPGHGGVLDRIDSIIAVLPFLAAALLYLSLPPVVAAQS